MEKVLRLTRKRQITIPKKILEKLFLDAGDALVLRVEGDRIVLEKGPRPLDEVWGISKEKAEEVGDIDAYVRAMRGERGSTPWIPTGRSHSRIFFQKGSGRGPGSRATGSVSPGVCGAGPSF